MLRDDLVFLGEDLLDEGVEVLAGAPHPVLERLEAVPVDEHPAIDVLAQRRVDALRDHDTRALERDRLLVDTVLVIDRERLHDLGSARSRRLEMRVEEVETDLGRPHPAEVGPPRRVVRLGREHVVVVLLEHHRVDVALLEGLGERLSGL